MSSSSAAFRVVLWNSAVTGWRALSAPSGQPGGVLSATWRTTATEGYADAEFVLAGRRTDVPGLALRRRIEFFGRSSDDGTWRLLYRGYIARIQTTRASSGKATRQTRVTVYGIFTSVGKLVCRQRYIFPEGGLDIGSVWSRIASRWGASHYPGVVVSAASVGQTLDAFDAYDQALGDVAQQLVEAAGGYCVSGGDVVTDAADVNAGKDRVFVRGFDPAPPAQSAAATLLIPDPRARTGDRNADEDSRRLVNVYYVKGGADRYPNLLAQAVQDNAGFEYPAFGSGQGGGSTGNQLIDPGFETHNAANVLSGGASFKSANLDEGPTDGGTWMVLLDNAGEAVTQTTVTGSVTVGDDYVFAPRLRLSRGTTSAGCQVRAEIDWLDSGGTLISSASALFDNTSTTPAPLADAIWRAYPVVSRAPAGASKARLSVTMTVMAGSSANHDGVLVDNWAFYDGSVVYQTGWELYFPGSGTPARVHWAYDADTCPTGGGAYAAYLAATVPSPNTDNQDVSLRPTGGARFPVSGNQSVRLSVWVKSPPGETATPALQLQLFDYGSDGHLYTATKLDIAASGAPLTTWQRYDLTKQVNAHAATVLASIVFRSTGALLVDDVSVRDAISDPATWLESGSLEYVLRADDATLGTSAAVQASIADYGEIADQVSLAAITTPADAKSWGKAAFTAHATPVQKPYVEQVGRCLTVWPGQYVDARGAEAAEIFPTGPLPLAQIDGSFEGGLVKQRFSLSEERESEVRRQREIARRISQQTTGVAGAGAGGSSGSPGGSLGGVGNGTDPLAGTVLGMTWGGTWASGTTYGKNVVVSLPDNSAGYISLADPNAGNDPRTDGGVHWQLLWGIGGIN